MSFITDLFGADKAKKAADAQQQGYENAEGVYRDAGSNANERLNPWVNTGTTANNRLMELLNGDSSNFQTSPGYQFALNEGLKARENSGSAAGMTFSGAQLKALEGYGQGMANQEYGNYFNRLLNLSNQGLGAGRTQANIDMTTANNVANAKLGAAGARASGYMADANIKNYLASSIHESGQRIGEAWATMGMGGGSGGMAGGGGLGG